jgi:hypothetical protein
VIGFIELLQILTINNYLNLAELYTPKVIVTTAPMKSSEFDMPSLVVAWFISAKTAQKISKIQKIQFPIDVVKTLLLA